ncbi:unnamed protein product [Ectocarpus sp. 12 AP-2014]
MYCSVCMAATLKTTRNKSSTQPVPPHSLKRLHHIPFNCGYISNR